MFRNALRSVLGLLVGLAYSNANAQAPEPLIPLTNQDVSRASLAEMADRATDPAAKGAGVPFVFPDDTKADLTYGIDVSHHNFDKGQTVDWGSLSGKRVFFVYIKASEGTRFIDPYFKKSWEGVGKVSTRAKPLLRGAYHFLSADVDAGKQAETFLRVLRENTEFAAGRDLPPVLDLEWDCFRDANGRVIRNAKGDCVGDYWSKYSQDEIVAKVKIWTDAVKADRKVTPVVYTHAEWWKSVKLGENPFLKGTPIWISDFRKASQTSGKPINPPTYKETLWQFTENGKIADTCVPTAKENRCVDTNVALSSREEFVKALGVTLP
jgi:lysozyme